ncbi:hypothetical protein BJV82DRAFT_663333 [Fennellomyces sp. T-0311]|nr:hypothetical protein BJV82DRAFT_663333 [Fennellomyces sp. T-0311]
MIPKKRKTASGWTFSSNGSHTAIAVEHQPTFQETLLPSLEQLTSGTTEALQNGAYDEAISQSSHLIHELLKRAAGLLKLRHVAWNKKANIAEELGDALQMIEFNPLDIDGYLSAADIYSIQGKQQNVIDTLQKALDVPITDDLRNSIQHQIDAAKQRLDRRVDFIAESPHDVFSSIVHHINGDDAMNCIEVSHTWRNRLLQSPIPWRAAGSIVKSPVGYTKDSATYKLLPLISRHVEELNLVELDPQTMVLCIDMTRTQLFPRLRSLYIQHYSTTTPDPGDLSIYLYNALPYIALTLTTLVIDEPCNTIISLGCILSICRNLADLRCTVYSIADCHGDGVPISHTTSLTRICLSSRATALTNVLQLVQLSPNLQFLELDNYEGDILSVIKYQHCPRLIAIVINKESFEELEVHALMGSEFLKPAEPAKLQRLALPNVRSAQPLLPYLQRGTELLSTLLLEPVCEGTTLVDWQLLSSFSLPCLEYLNINTGHASAAFLECFPGMLRCCPNLKCFKLIGAIGDQNTQDTVISTTMANNIFDAVADLVSLTAELEFHHIDIRGSSFIRLLQQYDAKNGRRLGRLQIKKCKGVTANVLHTIGKVQALVELAVHGAEEEVTASDVAVFTRMIAEMTYLRYLTLSGMKFNDDAALGVAHSKVIDSNMAITVPGESGITLEGRTVLEKRFKKVDFQPY